MLNAIQPVEEMTTITRVNGAASPIENWAMRAQRAGHPMSGVFEFGHNIDVLQAWEQVGGHKYGTVVRDAFMGMPDGRQMRLPDRFWLMPTWDGREVLQYNEDNELKKAPSLVSDRFEMVQPIDAIQVLYNYMRDQEGRPLNVTAIAATNSLSDVIVQWQTGDLQVRGDQIRRYVAARISLIGSIVGAFFDVRFFCMNKLPLLMANANFAISHRTGANDRLAEKFQNMMEMFNFVQGLHLEAYNVLAEIEMTDHEANYIVQEMYPYKLPSGYSQGINDKELVKLVTQGKTTPKSLKYADYRRLALQGIKKAAAENGRMTLWEGVQANYGPNHRMTRSYASHAQSLAFSGGDRRDEAIRGFRATMRVAIDRGYENYLPKAMVEAVNEGSLISTGLANERVAGVVISNEEIQ